MIRNHAEAIVHKKIKNLANLVGYNFRMGRNRSCNRYRAIKRN